MVQLHRELHRVFWLKLYLVCTYIESYTEWQSTGSPLKRFSRNHSQKSPKNVHDFVSLTWVSRKQEFLHLTVIPYRYTWGSLQLQTGRCNYGQSLAVFGQTRYIIYTGANSRTENKVNSQLKQLMTQKQRNSKRKTPVRRVLELATTLRTWGLERIKQRPPQPETAPVT